MSSSLTVPKYVSGKKLIIINDVSYMNMLISNGMFVAKTSPLKIEKTKDRTGGIILYQLTLQEVNTGLEKDVVIVVPPAYSSSIQLTESTLEDVEGKVAIWTPQSPDEELYRSELNTLFRFWMNTIQQNNQFGSIPEIKFLSGSTLLKWPWKQDTNEEYFSSFDPEKQLHQIRLGAGYYSMERNVVGFSLQLCSTPAKTFQALEEERATKKRKRVKKEVEEKTE
jgi:hypothetical protein